METTGSGRHKVIVLGEHAVVHGYPALGSPLGEQVKVEVRTVMGPKGIAVSGVEEPERVGEALSAMAAKAGHAEAALQVRVETGLLPGSGLGASAALSVAFARAILAIDGRPAALERVLYLAQEGERIFHGNPSGIDAWLASSTQPALFSRGGRPEPVDVAADLDIAILVDTTSTATSRMVAKVAERLETDPGGTRTLFEEMETLVLQGADAIREGRKEDLGKVMSTNHDLLERLGVTSEGLNRLCDLALAAGALGAKMTGGGGGGAVIALCRDTDHARGVAGTGAPSARAAFTARIARTER